MTDYNETDLERAKAFLKTEPADPQDWIRRSKSELAAALNALEALLQREGGAFAHQVRLALEERILKELNGRARLTDDTKEHSLSVHITPNGVIADIRLQIGTWKQ